MTKFTFALVALGFALFVGPANAGTIQDLAGLGYTVSISNPGQAGQNCPTYYISGHGIGVYANCQTPQADIDSWANPAAICNADWQTAHPDQLAAVQTIRQQGWSVTGDQCADTYTVSNPNTGEQVYTGPGAGLVSLDPGIPAAAAPAPSVPGGNPAPPADPSTGQCLPLCATPPTVTTAAPAPAPAAAAVTTTATASGTTAAPVNVTVNVTVNQAAQAAQEPTVTQGTNRLLASVITIAAKQTVIFTTKTRCRIKIVVVPCWKVYPQIAAARKITLLGRPGLGGVAVTSLTITP